MATNDNGTWITTGNGTFQTTGTVIINGGLANVQIATPQAAPVLKKKPVAKAVKDPTAPKNDYIILDSDAQIFSTNDNAPMSFDALDNWIGAITPDLGLLPPVVRYISPWRDRQALVIVEGRPQSKLIHWVDGTSWIINLPWSHWFIKLQATSLTDLTKAKVTEVGLAFSQNQLYGLEHKFYMPFLPNLMSRLMMDLRDDKGMRSGAIGGWQICFGGVTSLTDTSVGTGNKRQSLQTVFDAYATDYFNTNFNAEASWNVIKYAHHFDIPILKLTDGRNVQDHKKILDMISKLTTAETIDLLVEADAPHFEFKEIVDIFETNASNFKFGDFLTHVKNLNEAYVPPKVISSQIVEVEILEPQRVWDEDDCNEDEGCPTTHYDSRGDHW